jgi:hypothetical protein
LGSKGGSESIARTRKGYEEGITLGVNLVTVILMERCAQKEPARFQHVSVAFTCSLEQARRSFDVGEEQSDRSSWELIHATPPDA